MTDDVEVAAGELVNAGVIVHGTGILRVLGTIDGDLRVQAFGVALVRGVVTGDVVNTGGIVFVYGVIGGRVHDLGGRTYVDATARVLTQNHDQDRGQDW